MQSSGKATHRDTRAWNERLVLAMLYEHGPISRAEVARRTGLTRTTVSDVVAALIREGLAREVGRGPSTGGKAPILLELVDDARQVRVIYTARGMKNLELITEVVVVGKYHVLPQQYADYATLRGDASDGLPGVAGIGEKTAASLLTSYTNLEGILAEASRPGGRISGSIAAKLAAAIDYLAVAPTVVAVARDLDLAVDWDGLQRPTAPAHPEEFARLSDELGLGSSADRIVAALAGG